MTDIRVTYSGFIAFVVGIASAITGLIFTIIVTRKLDPQELGTWTLIGSLVSYVVIAEPIISYWTSRQIARGDKVGKTAFLTSGVFSIIAFFCYIVIAIFLKNLINIDTNSALLASILIPLTYLSNTLSGISLGHKPHAISFGMVGFELSKLPLGFALVYVGHFGLFGAILATIVATFVKLLILLEL